MKKLIRQVKDHSIARRIWQFVEPRQLFVCLTLAVTAAICLALVSVSLYYNNGFSRYDLSRPGYERERQEIAKPTPDKTYDTTSPVTTKTITEFLQEFDGHQVNLQTYGDFGDGSLSDEDLQITGAQ